MKKSALIAVVAGMLALAVVCDTAAAALIDVTWQGGTGSWHDPGNWDPNTVPSNHIDSYNALIDDGDTGVDSVVTLDSFAVISGLSVDIGDTLNVDGTSLYLGGGGAYTNNGTVNLRAAGPGVGEVHIYGGDVTLTGGGQLNMSPIGLLDGDINAIGNPDRLTNDGNTIRGAGWIGNFMLMTNRGIIDAAGGELKIGLYSVDPGSLNYNSGTMRAGAGASMLISYTKLTNHEGAVDGLIHANGGLVEIADTSVITGGVLQIDGAGGDLLVIDSEIESADINVNNGVLRADASRINDSTIDIAADGRVTLDDAWIQGGMINNAGTIDVGPLPAVLGGGNLNNMASGEINVDGGTFHLGQGSYANNGIINLGIPASSFGVLSMYGDVTLTGGGEVNMTPTSGVAGDAAGFDIYRLTNDGNTIRGSGVIGGGILLTNRGLIDVVGGELRIGLYSADPGSLNYNSGTMRAGAGASILFSYTKLTNHEGAVDGLIHADGGLVEITETSKITGGVLQIDGAGGDLLVIKSEIESADINANNGVLRVDNSQVYGSTIDVAADGRVSLKEAFIQDGAVSNAGTIDVGSGGATLTGGNLNNTAAGVVNADGGALGLAGGSYTNNGTINLGVPGSGAGVLSIHGGDVTLTGGGEVNMAPASSMTGDAAGIGPVRRLTNDGNTIRGVGVIGGYMVLTNRGLIDAAGGQLRLAMASGSPGFVNYNDGLIRAGAGGTVLVQSDMIGSGAWTADGGKLQLDAITVTTTGPITVINGGELELNSAAISGSDLTIDATGILDINSAVSLTGDLSFAGTDESKCAWGPDARLEMIGGIGASMARLDLWPSLEIGGADMGDVPAGFSDNFQLNELRIGPGAHVFLADLLDKANRNGPLGPDEALYVDLLVFDDADGVLNLNGLNLYFNARSVEGTIINIPVPEPTTFILVAAGLLPILRQRRRLTVST